MELFDVNVTLSRRADRGRRYLEFLQAPTLSVGVYHLAVGQPDPQGPHTRDEVYYVLSGRAALQVAEERQAAGPGAVVYVAAGVDHRFHDITEDLRVLVVFTGAPAT
jgi:mannose-6-phosphate isomerase-like protein (cupin superfamily)